MNFKQWLVRNSSDISRQVVWCHGDQPVLQKEVVDSYVRAFNPVLVDASISVISSEAEKQVWTLAQQLPLLPSTYRIVVVHEAQNIKDWSPLARWIENRKSNPFTLLVFVSSKEILPPLESVKKCGYVIACKHPNPGDMAVWANRIVPLAPSVAEHLVSRVGSNLRLFKSTCDKLAQLSGNITTATVDALCGEEVSADFVDSLILLDKVHAMSVTSYIPEQDQRMLVGLLNSRLSLMSRLHEIQIQGLSRRDISNLPDVPYFLADRYLGVAASYGEARCRYRRQVLALTDEALQSGAYIGVLESLVALWVST